MPTSDGKGIKLTLEYFNGYTGRLYAEERLASEKNESVPTRKTPKNIKFPSEVNWEDLQSEIDKVTSGEYPFQ